MKVFQAFTAALFATSCVSTTVFGAQCVSGEDMSALRTAALQQNLMVAALTCRDIGRYNHFVLAHQPELMESDARLKQFFIRHGGEAGYHTFKTELANAASLRSIRESDSFCGDAREMFRFTSQPISVNEMVMSQPVPIGVRYRVCSERDFDRPRLADAARPAHRLERPAPDADDANDGELRRSQRFDDSDDNDDDSDER